MIHSANLFVSLYSQHVQKLRKTRDASGVRSAGGTPTKSPAAKKASTPAKRPGAKVIEPKLAMDSQDEDDEIEWAGVKKEEDTTSDVLLNKRPTKKAKKSARQVAHSTVHIPNMRILMLFLTYSLGRALDGEV
jgi:hypothetical protein